MARNRQRASAHIHVRYLLLLFCTMFCSAQAEQAATVGFTCDFPGSDPSHYAISASSDGHASYISNGNLSKDSDSGETFGVDFTLPQATITHIFDLAKRARYFQGEVDSKKKNIASTGEKTLTYKDGGKSTVAKYNYSVVPAIQELTTLFQSLSTTLEFGRRLEYDYRYQKLALDEELKRMDDLSGRTELADITAIAPILQKISDDHSVMNSVRARAQRLLRPTSGSK